LARSGNLAILRELLGVMEVGLFQTEQSVFGPCAG